MKSVENTVNCPKGHSVDLTEFGQVFGKSDNGKHTHYYCPQCQVAYELTNNNPQTAPAK